MVASSAASSEAATNGVNPRTRRATLDPGRVSRLSGCSIPGVSVLGGGSLSACGLPVAGTSMSLSASNRECRPNRDSRYSSHSPVIHSSHSPVIHSGRLRPTQLSPERSAERTAPGHMASPQPLTRTARRHGPSAPGSPRLENRVVPFSTPSNGAGYPVASVGNSNSAAVSCNASRSGSGSFGNGNPSQSATSLPCRQDHAWQTTGMVQQLSQKQPHLDQQQPVHVPHQMQQLQQQMQRLQKNLQSGSVQNGTAQQVAAATPAQLHTSPPMWARRETVPPHSENGLSANSPLLPAKARAHGNAEDRSVSADQRSSTCALTTAAAPRIPQHQFFPTGGWALAVHQVREELMMLRLAHSEALAEQASNLRQDMESQYGTQNRFCSDQIAALRHDMDYAISQEREARMRETSDLRGILRSFQVALNSIGNFAAAGNCASSPPPSSGRALAHTSNSARNSTMTTGLNEVLRELEAEREMRCARDADLHAYVGREIGIVARRLEEQRFTMIEEVTETVRKMKDYGAQLQIGIDKEREERRRDNHEVRAICDSIWQRASGPHGQNPEVTKHHFKVEGEEGEDDWYKPCVGDPEDINTLYEMVREALGDSVHLRQILRDESDTRTKDQRRTQRLEKQVNTIQALLRDLPGLSLMSPTNVSSHSGLNDLADAPSVIRGLTDGVQCE